jgi:RNA polymerase sigma-70 factor (ECF subfamily)
MTENERRAQVELAVTGDQDALQRVIVEYHGSLQAAVARAMDPGLRRRFEPEDILQEAYVAAYRSVQGRTFAGPAPFYKWLERIARNEVKDRERALHRQKRDVRREAHILSDSRSSYLALANHLASPDSTPSRRVARSEAVAAVLSSLARLTDDQRHVVQLRYLEGLAVTDIAERLEKTEDAVHALCRRGLMALREAMVSISRYLSSL